ncbi:hypothetical protein TNCV_2164231 [Trichonephila clavipes]|nr:hypothetical protein TNCV_2164231 [Trichonephila clavipes]
MILGPTSSTTGKEREQPAEGPRGHGAPPVANAQPTNPDALCCEVCGRNDNEPEENPVNNDQQEPVPSPPSPDAVPPITSQAYTTAAAAPGSALLGE